MCVSVEVLSLDKTCVAPLIDAVRRVGRDVNGRSVPNELKLWGIVNIGNLLFALH